MTTTPETLAANMVRFQMYITREQHSFLKTLAKEKGISGGFAVRKGLCLYARKHGVILSDERPQQ